MKVSFSVLSSALCAVMLLSSVPLASADDDGIIIRTESVTDQASFLPVSSEGKKMELIAVRGRDGKVRIAWNTCQVCRGAPKAFFLQKGDAFICQNCGNAFDKDSLGSTSSGCNPTPVQGAIVENGAIRIPSSTIKSGASIFRNWKKGL